ncbi:MAG: class I SAM-dependent methyltransferase [Hyphomicrobiaceae bacterium]
MTETLKTGIPAVDRYLMNGYDKVRGFSSLFAAKICGHLLRRQSEFGIRGSVAEIGTFEGRFFIALGLAVGEGEHAYGFDLFAWPGSEVLERLLANADAYGLARDRFTPLSFDTGKLTAQEFSNLTGGAPLRFIHIDGDHSPQALTQDLRLAQQSLHPHGLICIDDMLHPAFPFLVVVVHDHLKRNPEMRLICVIDRENILRAPKFLICRAEAVKLYETDLMESFKAQHLTIGGDAMGHVCVVLTPDPGLADVRDDIAASEAGRSPGIDDAGVD